MAVAGGLIVLIGIFAVIGAAIAGVLAAGLIAAGLSAVLAGHMIDENTPDTDVSL